MEFNEKLQELRKSRGLTQEELAEALFVSRTAVSKWESGRGYPSIDSLKEISKYFSVSIDELLTGEKLISIAEKEKYYVRRKARNDEADQLYSDILEEETDGLYILDIIRGGIQNDDPRIPRNLSE